MQKPHSCKDLAAVRQSQRPRSIWIDLVITKVLDSHAAVSAVRRNLRVIDVRLSGNGRWKRTCKRAVALIYMSANPLELFSAYGAVSHPAELERSGSPERRKRARTRLHWPVLLFRNQIADAIESQTRDLSSDGFYCVANSSFTLGELLICTLKVPTHDPNGKHLERNLECKVRVMRVEPQETDGAFGVACRIEDYCFARVADPDRTQ
jgi:hypothetical protein